MQLRDAIHTRRSIRQYTDDAVTDAQLEPLLQAAMQAPSAGNAQTWDFVVVRETATKAALAAIHPGAAMVAKAPVALVVCGSPEREQMAGFWPQDCSAAAQNLLLTAHAAGLGACWVGVYPIEAIVTTVREAIGAPETVTPMAIIALGHPAEELPAEARFDAAKVHTERW